MDKKTQFMTKFILLWLIISASLESAYGLVAGISNVEVHNSNLDTAVFTTSIATEFKKSSNLNIREASSMENLLSYLETCKTGIVNCDSGTVEGMKALDIMAFSDIYKNDISGDYVVTVRAVDMVTWKIVDTETRIGKNPENIVEEAASEVADKLKNISENISEARKESGNFSISVVNITNGNNEAQDSGLASILDDMLISAISKNSSADLIEQTRVKDILEQKELEMSGIIQFNRNREISARGITHLLQGSLQIYEGTKSFSYSLINLKTGNSVTSDIVEWYDNRDGLEYAINKIARDIDDALYKKNGKLKISCRANDVQIKIIKNQSNQEVEFGICPVTSEDFPSGDYTLLFTHDDYDALSREISIKPMETTMLEKIELPQIDMSLYNSAMNNEFGGRYKSAIENYIKFYEKYPRHRMAAYAMYRHGYIEQIYNKNYAAGKKILENVISKKPDAEIRTEAYYGMALGYIKSGDKDTGKNILKMLMKEYATTTAAESARMCLDSGNCGT